MSPVWLLRPSTIWLLLMSVISFLPSPALHWDPPQHSPFLKCTSLFTPPGLGIHWFLHLKF